MTAISDPFDARLAELGARVARLLAADVRAFFPQTVRDRYCDLSAVAEPMDDDALGNLKREALEATERLAGKVESHLLPPALWLAASPPAPAQGTNTPPLVEHPPVAEIVGEIERSITSFLAAHGLPAEPVVYRLPMRFIDGDNLATLTMNFWKAVSRRHEQRQKHEAKASAAAAGERKRRWDSL